MADIGVELKKSGLWSVIERAYLDNDFDNALRSAVRYLYDLLKNKSELELDAAKLIEESVNFELDKSLKPKTEPRIKINNFKTESDFNQQKGLYQLLMGINSYLRNTLLHGSIGFSKTECDSFLYIINNLILKIEGSVGVFNYEELSKILEDQFYVHHEDYAKSLIQKIDPEKKLGIIIKLLNTDSSADNISHFLSFIMKDVDENDKKAVLEEGTAILSKLDYERHSEQFRMLCLSLETHWPLLGVQSRLRAENYLCSLLSQMENGGYSSEFRNILLKVCLHMNQTQPHLLKWCRENKGDTLSNSILHTLKKDGIKLPNDLSEPPYKSIPKFGLPFDEEIPF